MNCEYKVGRRHCLRNFTQIILTRKVCTFHYNKILTERNVDDERRQRMADAAQARQRAEDRAVVAVEAAVEAVEGRLAIIENRARERRQAAIIRQELLHSMTIEQRGYALNEYHRALAEGRPDDYIMDIYIGIVAYQLEEVQQLEEVHMGQQIDHISKDMTNRKQKKALAFEKNINNNGKAQGENHGDCTICLDNVIGKTVFTCGNCTSVFHKGCMKLWGKSCPNCRKKRRLC